MGSVTRAEAMSYGASAGHCGMTTFTTTLLQHGKTATGIEVPPEIVAELGSSRQPRVHVTIGRHTYANSVFSRGGRFLIPVSAENRELAGVAAGDEIEVGLALR